MAFRNPQGRAPAFRLPLTLLALLLGSAGICDAGPHSSLPFPVLDDYCPAMAIDSANAPWVVWISSFSDTSASGSGDAIYAARWTDGAWDTTRVTPERGRYLDPQIMANTAGVLVAWVSLDGPNSDVMARRCTAAWSDPFPVANGPDADFAPALSVDSEGGEWIAWQTWNGQSYDIYLVSVSGDSIGEPLVVADSPANDREPDLAPAQGGGVWVAWSSIRQRHDEIFLRRWDGGALLSPIRAVPSEKSWCRYPSVAQDGAGGVWIAYYHVNRPWACFDNAWPEPVDSGSIRVVRVDPETGETAVPCGTAGTGQAPRPRMEDAGYYTPANPHRIYGYRPRLFLDGSERVWVFSKMNGYYLESAVVNLYWGVFGVRYEGSGWPAVRPVLMTRNAHFWDEPAVVMDRSGVVWTAYTRDRRENQPVRGPLNILGPDASVRVDTFLVGEGSGAPPAVCGSHPVACWDPGIARAVPRHFVRTDCGDYWVYWGECHRHSCDLSFDAIRDLAYEETVAQAFERVGYDWIAPAEHVEWWTPLAWNMVSKWTDLHHIPGQLATFPGYEKWGRNLVAGMHGDQNVLYRSLEDWHSGNAAGHPAGWLQLYRDLRDKDVLCVPHHTADAEVFGYTMWGELVPSPEDSAESPVRVVEIFQSTRGSYEYPGCPSQAWYPTVGPDTGWVNLALEQRLRVGFIAGGDHGPGNGFTAILATDGSRDAIFEALRERRCYGTSFSKKIFVDFQVNGAPMGSEVWTAAPPEIEYRVVGTSLLSRVVVAKSGNPCWHVSIPWCGTGDSASFPDPDSVILGTSAWYYLRAEQWDGGVAWSSPVWVDFGVGSGVAEGEGSLPGGGVGRGWRVFPAPFVPSRGALEIVPPSGGSIPEVVRVYSFEGRLVAELDARDGRVIPWDGRDRAGREVASGVYFLGLDAGEHVRPPRKVVLVR